MVDGGLPISDHYAEEFFGAHPIKNSDDFSRTISYEFIHPFKTWKEPKKRWLFLQGA